MEAIYEDVKHPNGGVCSNSLSNVFSPGSSISNNNNVNVANSPISPFLVSQNNVRTSAAHMDINSEPISLNLANKNDVFLKAVVVAADCSNYEVKVS